MPGAGIPSSSRRHRNAAQSNIVWNNHRQSFDSHVKQLAATPGLNSGNQSRHAISNAALYFLGSLSSISNSAVTRSILPSTSGDISNYSSPTEVAYPAAIQPYVNKDYLVVNRDNIINMEYNYHETINATEYISFIEKGRKLFTEFYENYNQQHPPLKTLARNILKERIKQDFQMDIDPDNLSFMRFTITGYGGGNTIQYGPPAETKSLTECLFTNFDSTVQDNLQDMDALCGIYNSTLVNRINFNKAEAINIQPTKFIQTVWNIDFYEYAKAQYTDLFKDKNLHIKKLFLDFIHHLSLSQIDKNDIDDVLNAVGILNTHEVSAALFDINGYRAANAFVFTNESTGNVVLYFPESERKFFSFRSAFDMRLWVTNACATEKHRKMISSHFTIANRQDGVVFYGIDAWLGFIDKNHRYYDKIARKPLFIPSEYFFDYSFENIKDRLFADLDTNIVSDAEIRRNMWESAIDASDILVNPLTPFLSLSLHMQHMIEADTFDEKMREWGKIKNDIVNLLELALISAAINAPEFKGYEFIDKVKYSMMENDLNIIKNIISLDNKQPLLAQVLLPYEEIESVDINVANNMIKKQLSIFFNNRPHDLFYGLDDDITVPKIINEQRKIIKLYVQSAKKTLSDAIDKLNDNSYKRDIINYFTVALGNPGEDIIKKAISRFKLQISDTFNLFERSEARGYADIVIIASKKFAQSPGISHLDLSDSPMPNVISYVHPRDPIRRIFISPEAHIILETKARAFNKNILSDMDSIFIHEGSHLASDTLDFINAEPNPTALYSTDAATLLKQFDNAISSGALKDNSAVYEFMQRFYKKHGISGPVDMDFALHLIQNNPITQIDIMVNNADSFTTYTQDIANIGHENSNHRNN